MQTFYIEGVGTKVRSKAGEAIYTAEPNTPPASAVACGAGFCHRPSGADDIASGFTHMLTAHHEA